jgi:hypothetical protein
MVFGLEIHSILKKNRLVYPDACGSASARWVLWQCSKVMATDQIGEIGSPTFGVLHGDLDLPVPLALLCDSLLYSATMCQ